MPTRVLLCLLLATSCATTAESDSTTVTMEPPRPIDAGAVRAKAPEVEPIAADLAARLEKFRPIPIGVDDAKLDAKAKSLLKRLVEASQLMEQLYLRQVDPENPALRERLAADPRYHEALVYFDLMRGPWDRTDSQERPFLGSRLKPPQAGFYPHDVTKADVDRWIMAHPTDRSAFQSYFTTIERRKEDLVAVPYSHAYSELLGRAAGKLREAAGFTDDARLKTFLEKRAAAFESNDYFDSDVAWMDLGESPYEVTIGPYEVYDDKLMGWKASFEAFIGLRDAAESSRLAKVTQSLSALDKNLPLDDQYRKLAMRGGASPISVVQLLHSSGQNGVHVTAYNLPNDERVRKSKGSKKVMLKNVSQAKFEIATAPIAARTVTPSQVALVTFDAFFTYVLMHEMAHGLGPAVTHTARGDEDISKVLEEIYGPVEEAKADICGVVSTQWLIDHKVFPKTLEKQIYAAYLASVFRSIRFGATEAHARGELASFNYLLEQGGLIFDGKVQRYAVDFAKIKGAVRSLAHEWLTIEASGDRARAKAFVEKYGVMKPETAALVESLKDIPIDVRPQFDIEQKMQAW